MPKGYPIPEGRVKPWGTGHAILSCKPMIEGAFAVINADDYYGRDAFKKIYEWLSQIEDNEKYQYGMIGYQLYNTFSIASFILSHFIDIFYLSFHNFSGYNPFSFNPCIA